jgi:hypothetical protein
MYGLIKRNLVVSEVEPSSQVKTWNSKFARIWARVADESPQLVLGFEFEDSSGRFLVYR